ncbi:hypothetical protein [Pikeienuella sp. HZG-20]|uniref:hypothetical protein n=1 Tax=Paludibacillus litoralis TaxID=3133267 RepID=UPI0030ED4A9C
MVKKAAGGSRRFLSYAQQKRISPDGENANNRWNLQSWNFSPIFGFYAICATAAAADSLTPDQMCRATDATGLLSRPCAYSISRKTVDMVVDTNQEEATKMAIGLAKYAVEGTMVRISPPHAHDEPVAISVSR